jgi:hypothetical protein
MKNLSSKRFARKNLQLVWHEEIIKIDADDIFRDVYYILMDIVWCYIEWF